LPTFPTFAVEKTTAMCAHPNGKKWPGADRLLFAGRR
jgi:hypothetical protein